MTDLTVRTKSILAVALLVPPAASVWLMARPEFATASTYAAFAALVLATGAIAIHTWTNAQAAVITSQVIHEAELTGGRPRHR